MKNGLALLAFCTLLFVSTTNASPTFETGLGVDVNYHGDFESGSGISLIGRVSPENRHKIGVSIQRFTAAAQDEQVYYYYNGPGYGDDVRTMTKAEIDGYIVEVAPMFNITDSRSMKNFLGIGLEYLFATIEEKGYGYTNNEPEYTEEELSGNAPGFRFFFESQWYFSPQLAANFGFGVRFAKIANLDGSFPQPDYYYRDSYYIGGFNYYISMTYTFRDGWEK